MYPVHVPRHIDDKLPIHFRKGDDLVDVRITHECWQFCIVENLAVCGLTTMIGIHWRSNN